MWEYNYGPSSDELYHYGVKGMRWGHRKAVKIAGKRDAANAIYDKWDAKAKNALSKGKTRRAEKYAQNAAKYKAKADKYQGKIDKKIAKQYKKVGKAIAESEFYKKEGDAIYKKYNDKANALEKQAKYEDKNGRSLSAYSLREQAAIMRTRGKEDRKNQTDMAKRYIERSKVYTKKASELATATNTNLGKKKIDSIIKSSKEKRTKLNEYLSSPSSEEQQARDSASDLSYSLAKYRY